MVSSDFKNRKREKADKEADELWYKSEGRINPDYTAYVNYARKCLESGDLREAEVRYANAQNILSSDIRRIKREYLDSDVSEETKKLAYATIEEKQKEFNKIERTVRRIKRLEKGEWHGLEGKTAGTTAIVGIIAGLFFLSGNLTGNVIGSLNQTSSSWIGGVLFLIGLVGAFAYFKRR